MWREELNLTRHTAVAFAESLNTRLQEVPLCLTGWLTFCMFAPERSRRGICASGWTSMLDQDDPSALAYEEDVRADALPAGAVQAPRPACGADLRAWRYATQQKHPVLWGPVPAAEAARIAGAPAGCESVLIAPAIPSGRG